MVAQKFSKIWYVIGFLVLANIAVWAASAQIQGSAYLKLHIFDVGQGDGIYLRTPQGNDVLIDGGPNEVVLSKLGKNMPFTDHTIELAILTHPHADHVAGLVAVLQRYEVEKILLSDIDYETATYQTLLDLVAEKHIEVIRPRLGQRIFLDDTSVLDIYNPIVGEFDTVPSDPNETSVVARLSVGHMKVLLTGDAGLPTEEILNILQLPLDSEILKVGHQGSRTSTGSKFLQAVAPQYAVISVGRNNYGHPHPEVLGLLQNAGIETVRTDERGDAIFAIYPDHVDLID